MKKILLMLAAIVAILVPAGCTDNDAQLYVQLPAPVSKFMNQYFPGSKIASYNTAGKVSTLVLDDGPTIVFDSKCEWTEIDGNGSVLPQVLLFDQLPPAIYEYLQTANDLNNVFEISRNSKVYTVRLLASTLIYDISTGEITGR